MFRTEAISRRLQLILLSELMHRQELSGFSTSERTFRRRYFCALMFARLLVRCCQSRAGFSLIERLRGRERLVSRLRPERNVRLLICQAVVSLITDGRQRDSANYSISSLISTVNAAQDESRSFQYHSSLTNFVLFHLLELKSTCRPRIYDYIHAVICIISYPIMYMTLYMTDIFYNRETNSVTPFHFADFTSDAF